MPDTLALLKLEHEHAEHLLTLLEKQLAFAPKLDLDVLGDITAYFLDYPDQCHHPVEDMMYRRIRDRHPQRAAPLAHLLEDHAHINDVIKALARLVDQATWDASLLHRRLPDEASYFVKCYRNHMRAEEREFFPLAEALLTDEDWATLDFQLFDHPDPLYDPDAEARFHSLRAKIDAASEVSLRRAQSLREARWLRELHEVSAFNAQMTRSERPYFLMSHTRGGYSPVPRRQDRDRHSAVQREPGHVVRLVLSAIPVASSQRRSGALARSDVSPQGCPHGRRTTGTGARTDLPRRHCKLARLIAV